MSELKAAIAYFEDAVRESDEIIADCSPNLKAELMEQKRHFVVALDALRRAQPTNEPLTLEQLREMDGEPVWCVDCFGNQCWALVNVADDDCIDKETGAWNMGLYGVSDKPVDLTGWLAYRRPPERSKNG